MFRRLPLACLATAALACAQYAPPPEAYTITQVNSMMGPPVTMQIYRDGSKVIIDNTNPPSQPGAKGSRVRSLYDLQAHTNTSWSLDEPNPSCGGGTFSGDWGNPFAADMADELAKQHATQTGVETVNGLSTKVYEFDMPGATGKSKAWIESKYGLVMRIQFAQPSGPPKIVSETKSAVFAKPAGVVFAIPAACASAPHVPTEEERFAAETGEPASNFANATHSSGSKDSCAVLFRMVRAGSMTPVTSGFQVLLDTKPAQMQNGVLRIANAPEQFNVDVRVPSGGAEAQIYRLCAGPQTTLLMVVKDPENMSKGVDWLWAKSGKFAGH
jgi:hypothetical protein